MKVLVTGGSGLVGTAFKSCNIPGIEWVIMDGPTSGGIDLCDRKKTFEYFSKLNVDAVVHTAAKVGGIEANINNPIDFFSINSRININVLDAASHFGIKRCISFLSTCVYPNNSEFPLEEKEIHLGHPHNSNFAYAYSKRMLDIHSRAINKQKQFNYFCVSPNNLYGINDNFDLSNSHVIPALIRKMHDAKLSGDSEVKLWGTGTPLQEFTFANDIPKIVAFLLKQDYPIKGIINIGNTIEEISINKVARLIRDIFGYKIQIVWDMEKPNGQLRKPSSSEKLKILGYNLNSVTRIEDGLSQTIEWFLKEYPNIRGVV